MIFKNKKAQFEKVFTGIPVMLIVFFLSGVFIFIAFSMSHAKDLTQYQYFNKGVLSQSSILFENITLNGKETFISKILISEYNKGCGNNTNYNFPTEFREKLTKMMIGDSKFINKRSCLLLDIGHLTATTSSYFFQRQLGNCNLLLIKSGEDNKVLPFDTNNPISFESIGLNGKDVEVVDLNLNNSKISVYAYYGGC